MANENVAKNIRAWVRNSMRGPSEISQLMLAHGEDIADVMGVAVAEHRAWCKGQHCGDTCERFRRLGLIPGDDDGE